MSPGCVRCGVSKATHADIDPSTALEGICPRFDPPAPGWTGVITRAVQKLTEDKP